MILNTDGLKLSELDPVELPLQSTDLVEVIRPRADAPGRYASLMAPAARGAVESATEELKGIVKLALLSDSGEGVITPRLLEEAIINMLSARISGASELVCDYDGGTGELTVSVPGSCAPLIVAVGGINPNTSGNNPYAYFTNTLAAGLTGGVFKCVLANNSAFVDGNTWPMVCTIDWTTCNDYTSSYFINAALDMRVGSSLYNTPFTFVFTNVPGGETVCKAFVCGTQQGGITGGFGSVTLPGGAASALQNYGPGPSLSSQYNRLRYFVVRNYLGTLTGSFIDF